MIDVVGVEAAGLPVVGTRARSLIDAAEVVVGGERHLALLPESHPAELLPWPRPLRAGLPALLARCEGRRLVVLASGDPLLSGVGTTLIEVCGADAVRIHPAVSSATLARARMGWSAELSDVVTLVGRDVSRLRRDLHPGARLIVLVSGPESVTEVARLTCEEGYGGSRLVVLGDLGSDRESRVEGTTAQWAGPMSADLPRLAVLAIEARLDEGATARSTAPGLADSAYDNDGQLTKRHLRASALAALAPTPGALLWDLGAGAGSIGIEWARHHPRNRVVSVERDPARADRIARNAARLGVSPQLEVARTAVADFLSDAPSLGAEVVPDAIFIGGGAREEVLTSCVEGLARGGRLVVHGVTAETESLLVTARKRWGGELTRIAVEHAEPIGTYLGWRPLRTVVEWSLVKDSATAATDVRPDDL